MADVSGTVTILNSMAQWQSLQQQFFIYQVISVVVCPLVIDRETAATGFKFFVAIQITQVDTPSAGCDVRGDRQLASSVFAREMLS